MASERVAKLGATPVCILLLPKCSKPATVLRGEAIGPSGKMGWGDKIVVAIALLCFALIVIALFLAYTGIRATIAL